MRQSIGIGIIVWAVMATSCDSSRHYQEFTDFEAGFWHQDSVVNFRFDIENPQKPYRLKALFRHSQAYPYHNMYYKYTLLDANDSLLDEQLLQVHFFDPKTGDPLGSGIGDLFDVEQVVQENYTFPQAGTYQASLQQYMRLDTLPFVLSAGWRVEYTHENEK